VSGANAVVALVDPIAGTARSLFVLNGIAARNLAFIVLVFSVSAYAHLVTQHRPHDKAKHL
jgi:hypothetical protein